MGETRLNTGSTRNDDNRRHLHRPAAALLLVAAAFVLVYAERRALGLSNVDDYLYALQTDALAAGGPRAWSSYPTTSPLVPTLAAPIAWLSASPHVGGHAIPQLEG